MSNKGACTHDIMRERERGLWQSERGEKRSRGKSRSRTGRQREEGKIERRREEQSTQRG